MSIIKYGGATKVDVPSSCMNSIECKCIYIFMIMLKNITKNNNNNKSFKFDNRIQLYW